LHHLEGEVDQAQVHHDERNEWHDVIALGHGTILVLDEDRCDSLDALECTSFEGQEASPIGGAALSEHHERRVLTLLLDEVLPLLDIFYYLLQLFWATTSRDEDTP
jgi:hypothetical protein